MMSGTRTAETLASEEAGLDPASGRKRFRRSKKDRGAEPIEGKSPFAIAMGRLRKDPVAIFCAVIVAILVLLAIFADVIAPSCISVLLHDLTSYTI